MPSNVADGDRYGAKNELRLLRRFAPRNDEVRDDAEGWIPAFAGMTDEARE